MNAGFSYATWVHVGPSVLAAFLASLVEFVEALTIVLAVGTVRGWRPALAGTAGGVLFLAAILVFFGPLLHLVRLEWLQLAVGILLLLFGMRWLRKAILRAAGIVPLHDETEAFARQQAELSGTGPARTVLLDPVAIIATFKAVTLEGIEVVFIVLAVGATGNALLPAAVGAAAAGCLVIAAGIALHRPLARVPENALKFAVGVLISAFGCFWIGEGLGFGWPGDDLAILALVGVLLAAALAAAALARRVVPPMRAGSAR
jgi:uncharacterized membrane protein